VARLEEALSRLGDEISAERVMVLVCLGQQWGLGDHVDRAHDYAQQALAIAERLGEAKEMLRAIGAVVRTAPREAVAERERLLLRELALARQLREPSAEVQALGLLRMFSVTKGDRALFERCLDDAEPVLERTQNLANKGFYLVGRALSAVLDGDWQRADEIAQRAYQATSRTFGPAGVQMFAIHQSIQLQIHGRNAELLAMLEESAATHAQPAWRAALAMANALQDEPEKARAVLSEFCADDMAALPVDGNWLSGAGLLAIGADLIGDRDAAAVLYARLLPFAGSMINVGSTAGIHGSTWAHIGAMCGLLDRWEEGERVFTKGITQTDAFGHRHYESDSRLSFARFYQRRGWPGDTDSALRLVNEALEIARKFQMEGYIQRAIAMKLEIQGAVGESTAGSIHALTKSIAERDVGEVSGVEGHGLTTLMFSDMAGFTSMTERLGDVVAREVIRTHNSIVREQLNSHGGVEVELQGDGFLLAFSDPVRALDCGVAIQRAFAAENQNGNEPIHVRIGLHSGTALRDGGKFFGKTVILAARIAAQAVGDQLLISDSLKSATDGRYAVTDTRVLELKGIADPQTVHSVVWDE
jgi:class 3 adenylate cyclase